MPRRPAIPDDDALREEIKATLISVMRNATKEKRISYECDRDPNYRGDGRGFKHQINIPVTDYTNVVKAAGELLDRMEGKAATKREVPKVKMSGRPLEELSDEELEAMISGGSDGSADGQAA